MTRIKMVKASITKSLLYMILRYRAAGDCFEKMII